MRTYSLTFVVSSEALQAVQSADVALVQVCISLGRPGEGEVARQRGGDRSRGADSEVVCARAVVGEGLTRRCQLTKNLKLEPFKRRRWNMRKLITSDMLRTSPA